MKRFISICDKISWFSSYNIVILHINTESLNAATKYKMKNVLKEWKINAPWGKIALISWGDPIGPSVLLVHGREDSAATFIPLLQHLPNHYHYVAIDLPGCGKSDAFPIGLRLTRFTNIVALDLVVRHLQWTQFIYIAHSLGTEIGCFYNAIYPHKMVKCVYLDPLPAWRKILQPRGMPDFFQTFYEDYYKNYKKNNTHDRLYTKNRAVSAVMRARGVTEEQAGVLLSRNMVEIGADQYRLSWDRRQKLPAPFNMDDEYYIKLFSANCPPTLVINATNTNQYLDGRERVTKLMETIRDRVDNYKILTVEGDHDLHFKHPERFMKELLEFIDGDVGGSKAKL